jgi:hypothetical protein
VRVGGHHIQDLVWHVIMGTTSISMYRVQLAKAQQRVVQLREQQAIRSTLGLIVVAAGCTDAWEPCAW